MKRSDALRSLSVDHHHGLVAHAEENDRAGQHRDRTCKAGNGVADGDHH